MINNTNKQNLNLLFYLLPLLLVFIIVNNLKFILALMLIFYGLYILKNNVSVLIFVAVFFIGYSVFNPADMPFRGIQYILPFFYSIFLLFVLITKKYSAKNKDILEKLMIIFFFLLIFLIINSYVQGTPIKPIVGRTQYWLFACILFFFLSMYRFKEIEIIAICKIIFFWSIIWGLMYLYVYYFGKMGYNFGFLFMKKYEAGVLRILGGLLVPQTILILYSVNYLYKLIKIPKLLMILSIILYLYCFLVQQTRAYFVSSIFAILLLYIISHNVKKTIFQIIAIILVLGISGTIFNNFFPSVYKDSISRYLTVFGNIFEIPNIIGRQLENKWAFSLFIENPIFGVGVGSNKFVQPHILSGDATIYGVHNNYFFILTNFGIFGLIIFLLISYKFLKLTYQNRLNIMNPFFRLVFISSGLVYAARLLQGWSTMIVDGSPFVFLCFLMGINIAILNLNDRQSNNLKKNNNS